MLTEERFARIVSLVEARGSVTVTELMEEFGSSESTIRRDLTTLDRSGRLLKVRGGAIARNGSLSTRDDEVASRMERNIKEKGTIGSYAAALITPEDFVYIDAGTTTDQMLSHITCKDAVYVTNAVSHAMKLATIGCRVYILGGEFKHATEAIVGEEAIASLAKYNFTKGFFGTNGITKKNGFTTPEVKEAMVKQRAMESCREKYVLADGSKFGGVSAISFGAFDSATIITDAVVRREFAECRNIVEVSK
ncbi:MAG: DeoR/GlpR transcriptional regulator [Lachnospiraceae bacterium]|nr:DeoR/GlpR transcriptional regulator [Lachnospiraceae bacterium]